MNVRTPPGDPFVRLDRVTKVYEARSGSIHAVEEVSLDVHRGEFLAIVGPSGCGKSTLMLMTAGLVRHSGGTITIDKTVVTRPYTDLGIVFQDAVLLDWRTVMACLGAIVISTVVVGLVPAWRVGRPQRSGRR